jgi:hypothetical protein
VEYHVALWHTAPREIAQDGGPMFYIKTEKEDAEDLENE